MSQIHTNSPPWFVRKGWESSNAALALPMGASNETLIVLREFPLFAGSGRGSLNFLAAGPECCLQLLQYCSPLHKVSMFCKTTNLVWSHWDKRNIRGSSLLWSGPIIKLGGGRFLSHPPPISLQLIMRNPAQKNQTKKDTLFLFLKLIWLFGKRTGRHTLSSFPSCRKMWSWGPGFKSRKRCWGERLTPFP